MPSWLAPYVGTSLVSHREHLGQRVIPGRTLGASELDSPDMQISVGEFLERNDSVVGRHDRKPYCEHLTRISAPHPFFAARV